MKQEEAVTASVATVREMLGSVSAVKGERFSLLVQFMINIGTGSTFNKSFCQTLDLHESDKHNLVVIHDTIYFKMLQILKELCQFTGEEAAEAFDWAKRITESVHRSYENERSKRN